MFNNTEKKIFGVYSKLSFTSAIIYVVVCSSNLCFRALEFVIDKLITEGKKNTSRTLRNGH